jgi:hypothetical protein
MPRKFTAKQVADLIQIPLNKWPGNCYGIAQAVLEAGFIKDGKLRYGHWHGFIHPDSPGFGGRQFTHHAWIQSGDRIVDPTRWVFENVEPYIYSGPAKDDDYDFGGNHLRKQMMKPIPDFDESQKCYGLTDSVKPFVQMMTGNQRDEVSIQQVMWLANLPLDMLQDKAEDVFKWITYDVGLPGFIPLDNRMEILG